MPPRPPVSGRVAPPGKAPGGNRGAAFRSVVQRVSVSAEGGGGNTAAVERKAGAIVPPLKGGETPRKKEDAKHGLLPDAPSRQPKQEEDIQPPGPQGSPPSKGGGKGKGSGKGKGKGNVDDPNNPSAPTEIVNKEAILAKEIDEIQTESLMTLTQFVLNKFAKKSLEEVAGSLQKAIDTKVLQKVARGLWKILDTHHRGKISLADYIIGFEGMGFHGGQTQRMFFLLDEAHQGRLSRNEFVDKMEAWIQRAALEYIKEEERKKAELEKPRSKEGPKEPAAPPVDIALAELSKMQTVLSLCIRKRPDHLRS